MTTRADEATSRVGVYELFHQEDFEHVERVLADLRMLGVRRIRTVFSWAYWCAPGGQAWYRWLIPRLSAELDVVPCFVSTPPFLGVVPKTSAPPRDPKWYADFIDQVVTLLGDHFEWIELWTGPSDLREWDVELDPEWMIFSEMVGGAAYWAKQRGKKTVLGSSSSVDPHWVRLMCERNVMRHIDAVGIDALQAAGQSMWPGWPATVTKVREVLARYDSNAEIWITAAGYSTFRGDERQQLSAFVAALDAPVQRVYWHATRDAASEDALVSAPEHHFGLLHDDGSRKLLARLWESGGLDAVRETDWWGTHGRSKVRRSKPTLITGGAGFIGTNLAHRLLSSGSQVLILDNLSRPGVERNFRWLRDTHGSRAQLEMADVRDAAELARAVGRASRVFHFAAQTAVTTSLDKPLHDFDVNARGTLNLLEALRALEDPPPLLFTSTNKVYGSLSDVTLRRVAERYEPDDARLRAHGIGEDRPLDFHSPYGCSKGTADQYILDYARCFGLPAVVFRMSCIYGPHQMGNEDQGWIAHFLLRALRGEPITLYGDGRQVRDVLHVDDLLDALLAAQAHVETLRGQAFNVGGGVENTVSLLEVVEIMKELRSDVQLQFGPWRAGDQRYYVSDTAKLHAAVGWSPRIPARAGIEALHRWLMNAADRAPRSTAVRSPALGIGG